MATLSNNSAVNFILYTKDNFSTSSDGEQLYASTGDIVFIEKESTIFLNGTYYGVSDDQKQALLEVTSKITNVERAIGNYASLTTTLIGIIENLRGSIDGQGIEDGDPKGKPQLWTKTGVLSSAETIVEAIEALADKVNVISDTGASILQGSATNTDISASQITITTVQDIVDTIGKVIGSGDSWQPGEQKTLSKLRELIAENAEAINILSGDSDEGLADILAKIKDIEDELQSGDGTIVTLIDGLKIFLKGLSSKGASFTLEDQPYTDLQSILDALINKIAEAKTMASSAAESASEAAKGIVTSEIDKLDATVRGSLDTSDTVTSGNHIGVKIVEEAGKLTNVLVVETDIASATTVNGLSQSINSIQAQVANVEGALKWKIIN